ncbi:MAG: ribbon-helix-helix protein, CopG family [Deltaproteobacteria bacterium]|nr:ribbon-helix-helix protein, CopG family [Deltaproteobacteria bacterium]
MAGVKTAISLDEELFDKINKLAHELHVSRSRLFTIAVEDYLKKQENQSLLAQLNSAYSAQPDDDDDEERKISQSMRDKHTRMIERESW